MFRNTDVIIYLGQRAAAAKAEERGGQLEVCRNVIYKRKKTPVAGNFLMPLHSPAALTPLV